MHYQQLTYWCGPASVQNALEWIGIKRTQEQLAELAQTTAGGTDEFGILRAVRESQCAAVEHAWAGPRAAFRELDQCLADGHPLLLCVDRWSHWICVVGRLGERYTVLDPERTTDNDLLSLLRRWQCTGVQSVHKRALLRRWRMGIREQGKNEKALYAIEVMR